MSDDSVFSEIDEELRAERSQALWRKFAPWVFGAAFLIVVLVAANEGWRWYQNSISQDASEKLYKAYDAIEAGDLEAAQAALDETIATNVGQYPQLAQFAQAALLAQDGNLEEAKAAYAALTNSLSDARLREMAILQQATLLVDEGDVLGVQTLLATLLSTQGPMRSIAQELLALTQYAAGDGQAARITFEEIRSDPLATSELLQRIEIFDLQLISQGIKLPAEPAEDADAAADAE